MMQQVAERLVATNHLQLLGIGGPREAAIDTFATTLEQPRYDDFRKLLIDHTPQLVLLSTSQGISRDDRLLAMKQNALVLSMEPMIDELAEVEAYYRDRDRELPAEGYAGIVHLPCFLNMPGYIAANVASDTMAETMGATRQINITSTGPTESFTLFSRLFDAWHTTLEFLDLPEVVDASFIDPTRKPMLRPALDEEHAKCAMLVHARFADGAACLIHAASGTSHHQRQLSLISDHAELNVTDNNYRLAKLTGELIDQSTPTNTPNETTLAQLLADQVLAMLDNVNHRTIISQPRYRDILACCHACMLSAKTQSPESPEQMLKLAL